MTATTVTRTPEQLHRDDLEAKLRAMMTHPTALANIACFNKALEMSLDLWPFRDMDRDIRYAQLKAMANVERLQTDTEAAWKAYLETCAVFPVGHPTVAAAYATYRTASIKATEVA